jgi:hypothetical protein
VSLSVQARGCRWNADGRRLKPADSGRRGPPPGSHRELGPARECVRGSCGQIDKSDCTQFRACELRAANLTTPRGSSREAVRFAVVSLTCPRLTSRLGLGGVR